LTRSGIEYDMGLVEYKIIIEREYTWDSKIIGEKWCLCKLFFRDYL